MFLLPYGMRWSLYGYGAGSRSVEDNVRIWICLQPAGWYFALHVCAKAFQVFSAIYFSCFPNDITLRDKSVTARLA